MATSILIGKNIKLINKKVKKHPILFACSFACVKNIVADYTVQKTQQIISIRNNEKPKPFNIKRNITFALFGFIHVGAG